MHLHEATFLILWTRRQGSSYTTERSLKTYLGCSYSAVVQHWYFRDNLSVRQ